MKPHPITCLLWYKMSIRYVRPSVQSCIVNSSEHMFKISHAESSNTSVIKRAGTSIHAFIMSVYQAIRLTVGSFWTFIHPSSLHPSLLFKLYYLSSIVLVKWYLKVMAESNCYAKDVYGFNSAIGPSDIMNVVVSLHNLLKTPRPSIECCSQTMAHLFIRIKLRSCFC